MHCCETKKYQTAVFIIFSLIHSVCFAYDFAGGTGEPNDPYQIETAEQLLQLGSDPNLLDKCYILNNDIDLDPNVTGIPPFTRAIIAPDINDNESGYQGTPYTAIFDGNNQIIINLMIDASGNDYLGLFGYTDPNSEIRDINFVNTYISGGGTIGGIIGHNEGLIENCHFSGIINSIARTGGIAGKNYGWIISCSSNIEILAASSHYIGGLVGSNETITIGDFNTGIIIDCNSSGRISGRENIGGLVGYNKSCIYDSFSTADVCAIYFVIIPQGYYAGGLIGLNDGIVDSCYASGNVTADGGVGGLIGGIYENHIISKINNCYSTGSVSSSGTAGGLIGYAIGGDTEITHCYSTSDVNCAGRAGGLIGYANGIPLGFVTYNNVIKSCYSSGNVTSSGDEVGGLIGNASMFSIIDCNSDSNVTGDSYVGGLIGSAGFGGRGSPEPIEKLIDSCYATGTVKATGNKIGGLIGSVPRGTEGPSITAKIRNCHAQVNFELNNDSDYIGGLIGYSIDYTFIGYSVMIIENCSSVVDINVGTNSSAIGGLIGHSYDISISNSYTSGSIKTLDNCSFIGGLIGEDFLDYSHVSDCNSEITIITGSNCEYIGGLCGTIYDAENCYSIANINTASQCTYIGGLCGEGDAEHCYSIADIDTASQCTYIGGLCGEGDADYCYSIADINTESQCIYIGGLAGNLTNMSSYNSSDVNIYTSNDCNYIGGLLGYSAYLIGECYSTGKIHTSDFCSNIGGFIGHATYIVSYSSSDVDIYTSNDCSSIGGLVGKNDYAVITSFSKGNLNVSNNCHSIGGIVGQSNGGISDSYFNGNIIAYDNCEYIGGLVGVNNDKISYSYSSSQISAPNDTSYIGGLCGSGADIYKPSFWDIDTSSLTKGIGGPEPDPNTAIGLPTEQMQIASTFLDAGWKFDHIWAICEGTNYPRLQWQILPADFLCPDGVDFLDYAHFSDYWLNENCDDSNDCEGADFDLSGSVDGSDLKTFTDSWLEEYLPALPPY